VSKVYEFGGGKVKEHLGGIYDYLRSRNMESLNDLNATTVFAKTNADDNKKKADSAETSTDGSQPAKLSYAEHKEQQKKIRKAEKAVKECETKIEKLETRKAEIDALLMKPENATNMELVTEYTELMKSLDEENENWMMLSEELEEIKNS
jgi:ATP-binding cassette subfamily F protein 3